MKAIIQTDLYERSYAQFAASGIELLRFPAGQEESMLKAQRENDVRCLILGADYYSERFFASLTPRSLVIRYGVGYDNIPTAVCRERALLVAYTPGTLSASVAEHALALMLACARQIPQANAAVKAGCWSASAGIELSGKTLAIIGLGDIGRKTAAIAKYGFGMTITAFDLWEELPVDGRELVDAYSSDYAQTVADADFVSLHLAVNDTTRGFLNADRLRLMPKRTIVINTSRGQLVKEDDLYQALLHGTIAGAGLDVFANEPYLPVGPDLRTLENVVCTPHVSSNTDAANQRMAEGCIANVRHFTNGEWEQLVLIPECRDYLSSVVRGEENAT